MFTRLVFVICGLTFFVAAAEAQLVTWKGAAVGGLAFSPDGKWLAAGGPVPFKAPPKTLSEVGAPRDGLLSVWDVTTRKQVFHLVDHEKVPNCLAFSPAGGGLLAVGYRDKFMLGFFDDVNEARKRKWPLIVWNITRKKEEIILPSVHSYDALAFSSDGKLLATAFSSIFVDISPTVTIYEMPSGEKKYQWTLPRRDYFGVNALSFSPNAKQLALGVNARGSKTKSKGMARVVDIDSGKTIVEFSEFGDDVHSVAFSPDGKYLAVGVGPEDPQARVYDWSMKKVLFHHKAHSKGVWAVSFGHNGNILITGGLDRDAKNADSWKMWNIAKGECLHTELATVLRMALSPDGRILATGTGDEIKLWQVPK